MRAVAPEPVAVNTWTLPADGEAHLWRIDMDAAGRELDETLATLDADERSRAARFRFAADRQRFIRRRGALRAILAGYTRAAPEEIRYEAGSHGKPALRPRGGAPGLVFNVSDSGSLAVVAVVRDGRIGVDVEAVDRCVECLSLARRFFAPEEFEVLAGLDPAEHRDAFFRAWTRKEALLKGLGGGLLLPLDSFEVALVPSAPADILRWDVPGEPRGEWTLAHLEPGTGYVGALAADRPMRRVSWRTEPVTGDG